MNDIPPGITALPNCGKLRRGTPREDGRVYWGKKEGYHIWVTPEKLQEKKEKYARYLARREEPPKRHTLGDVREDGMIFWARSKSAKNGEVWVSRQKFEEMKARAKKTDIKWRAGRTLPPKKYKAGYVREDGMVFWGRSKAKGEMWMTPERFHIERHNYNKNARLKWASCDIYRQSKIWRASVRRILRSGEDGKYVDTESLLGCTASVFKHHMENLFKEGMTWKNRQEWHIDHKIPCASATSIKHLAELFHFKNLQPLWVEENHVKGSKTR